MKREIGHVTIAFKRQPVHRIYLDRMPLLIAGKPAVVVFRSAAGACTIVLTDIDS